MYQPDRAKDRPDIFGCVCEEALGRAQHLHLQMRTGDLPLQRGQTSSNHWGCKQNKEWSKGEFYFSLLELGHPLSPVCGYGSSWCEGLWTPGLTPNSPRSPPEPSAWDKESYHLFPGSWAFTPGLSLTTCSPGSWAFTPGLSLITCAPWFSGLHTCPEPSHLLPGLGPSDLAWVLPPAPWFSGFQTWPESYHLLPWFSGLHTCPEPSYLLPGSQAFTPGLDHPTSPPGYPAQKQQTLGLLMLHNHEASSHTRSPLYMVLVLLLSRTLNSVVISYLPSP